MRLQDIMSEDVLTVAPGDSAESAWGRTWRDRAIGSLPVVDKGRLVGIVTISDLLSQVGRGAEKPVVRGTRWTLRDRGPRHVQERRSAR